MPHAHTRAGLRQHVGGLAHVFHAAGDHDTGTAGLDLVVGLHHRFHAGAAHLVDGGGTGRIRDAGLARRLTSRRLPQCTGQYTAHDHFINIARLQAGTFDGRFDGHRTQVR